MLVPFETRRFATIFPWLLFRDEPSSQERYPIGNVTKITLHVGSLTLDFGILEKPSFTQLDVGRGFFTMGLCLLTLAMLGFRCRIPPFVP